MTVLDLLWRCPDAGAWTELVREQCRLSLACVLKRLADWEGQEGLVTSKGMYGVKKREAQGPSMNES